ncbi:family 78 glycoside hydrolase catalytic domain [Butyrivibrio sp. WCD3002]|uniref:family 78 glycoside hydrolase catalytic domain n=1 Tax=Butyrivibrio sp. WCD3002 TaxID=1280676 RepID=UPI00040EA403|nr:family 78 glycoside hydrolase catalytic domain [Butyrivibrio sp. WCD3002]
MKATRLRTEYLKNPIGIDIRKPRLSWVCEGGKKQSAYQIKAFDDRGTILWDTGKVSSDRMHLISWMGDALTSRTKVFWQVQLWDENDVQGEISEIAQFEMGLLSGSDWTSKWITGDYVPEKKTRYPADCFKKSFTLPSDKKVKKARAYMTACGLYEGKLNGEKIGKSMLAPGITDYRKRIQYQTVDITDSIRSGENELFFMLADGWYRGSVGAWAMKNYYGSETKLLAQIEVFYEDGSCDVIGTDDSFLWTNEGPVRFADNKDGEIYDARKESFENVNWSKAKVTSHNVVPTASNNFLLTEHERLSDPELITTPSGKKVLDFKQNIAGIVEFKLNAKAGQRIFMRFGELMRDGEFTQKNIQCVRKNLITPLQQVEYFCRDGLNEYKTRFAIFGFQYIEVETDFDINPSDFTAIAVYSDFETTYEFNSSNELLNKFVVNTLWSLKNNSADLPTDCPTRERHGWTGDAQLFLNTATYMTNYLPFALKFENDLCDWQGDDGNFPQIAPEGGTDSYMRVMNGSVGWSDAGILIPYRLWKKYGDRSIIENYYENMKKYAKYMIGRTGKKQFLVSEKTGLQKADSKYLYNMGQHYGEWAEPEDVHKLTYKDFMTSRPEEATAYLYYVMDVMVEIAEELGKTDDIQLYEEYRDGAKATYQKLRHLPKYTLDTDRQARLVRPLYFGLLDEKDTAFAKERLIKALDNYDWRVGTGFLSTPFILYVLSEIDPEYAYKLLENEKRPGWLCMPKAGATTIWEDWAGPDSDNGKGGGIASLNHYSKGAVCEWIFEEMCGIKVADENLFIIKPVPGGHFTHASASYDSAYGKVSCGWKKKEDGSYEYEITIPANTTAVVELPGKEPEAVSAGKYKY